MANDFLGWLFGEINISKSIFDDSKVNYMKVILQKELLVTFSDYKKTLLINMMNILNGLDDELVNSKAYSYGTYNYNVVWEGLVNSVFGNVKNISDFYPHASWNLDKLNMPNQSLVPLRQDSIYFDKFTNKYFIYDAKYYSASLHKLLDGLPSTSDIEKQIIYGQEISINKNVDPNKIYNAFILPYNKKRNLFGLNENIQYIGEANPSWVKKNYTYERVKLIFVDTYFLLNEWKNKTIKWYREMTKIIEENL